MLDHNFEEWVLKKKKKTAKEGEREREKNVH